MLVSLGFPTRGKMVVFSKRTAGFEPTETESIYLKFPPHEFIFPVVKVPLGKTMCRSENSNVALIFRFDNNSYFPPLPNTHSLNGTFCIGHDCVFAKTFAEMATKFMESYWNRPFYRRDYSISQAKLKNWIENSKNNTYNHNTDFIKCEYNWGQDFPESTMQEIEEWIVS